MQEIELDISAGRLLYGLSRIGYTTTSAICDIIDNSVRAEAKNISVQIKKMREELADTRKNNVNQYIIIDNGKGMGEAAMLNALKLGSDDLGYERNCLSKFGLGLKSAAFSQCDNLILISSDGSTPFVKYQVSLPKVIEANKYFAEKINITKEEQTLIDNNLKNNHGTIVILDKVRQVNHPSVRKTLSELKQKIGVIYYYFIAEGTKINIVGDVVEAVDPLFAEEANRNGNLNEHEWDGQSVRWIERPRELLLDEEEGTKCKIEITQLVYPPIYKILHPNASKDAEMRNRYMIGAGNYGFYVYRNKRLIAWASLLDGIIPQDQDYYAFRGRIFIDDSADDFFNIDVKKSTLTLSDEAYCII